MRRRLLIYFLAATMTVAALAVAAWAFRHELARWAIETGLARAGLTTARFQVDAVSLTALRLTDLRLDRNDRAGAEALEARFTWRGLIDGRIDSLTLTRPHLRLDLTGAEPLLGPLQSLLSASTKGTDASPPALSIEQGRLVVSTDWGEVPLQVSGRSRPDAAGGWHTDLSLTTAGRLGHGSGTASLTRNAAGRWQGLAEITSAAIVLPEIQIERLTGTIALESADTPPAVRAKLSAEGIVTPDGLFQTATIGIEGGPAAVAAVANLTSKDRLTGATARFTASDLQARPQLSYDLSFSSMAGGRPWDLVGLPQPAAGSLEANLIGSASLPPLADLGGLSEPTAWLSLGEAQAKLTLGLVDVTYPQALESLQAEAEVDLALGGSTLTATAPRPPQIAVAVVDADWLESLGFPADAAAELAPGATLRLAQDGAPPPQLRLGPANDGDGWSLVLSLPLRLDLAGGGFLAIAGDATLAFDDSKHLRSIAIPRFEIAAADFQADGHLIGPTRIVGALKGPPGALRGTGDFDVTLARTYLGPYPLYGGVVQQTANLLLEPTRLTATFAGPGTLTVERIVNGNRPLFQGTAVSRVEGRDVILDWGATAPYLLTHDTVLVLGERALVLDDGRPPRLARGDFGRLHIVGQMDSRLHYGGTFDLRSPSLALPFGDGVELTNLALTWIEPPPGRPPIPGSLSVEEIALRTDRGNFGGMSLQATLLGSPSAIRVEGGGRGPQGIGQYSLQLDNEGERERGSMRLSWGPVRFRPGGLQPRDLSESLASFTEASGSLALAMAAAWSPVQSSETVEVILDDLSFRVPWGQIAGLTSHLTFDSLAPLRTPPGQSLALAELNAGVAIHDVKAQFGIVAEDRSGVAIEAASFTMAKGQFGLSQAFYDFGGGDMRGRLAVDRLDLAAISDSLAIRDFAMEGIMSGSIPFAIVDGDTLTIDGAALAAEGPGAIRIGAPQSAYARAGGDPNLTLALQALEDFRFTQFDLGLTKDAEGAAELTGVLQGGNPEVLEGHPIRLNLRISTHLGSLLAALRRGLELNVDLFRSEWSFN